MFVLANPLLLNCHVHWMSTNFFPLFIAYKGRRPALPDDPGLNGILILADRVLTTAATG